MNEILDSELNSAFVAGEREFMGQPLAPYTEGSRMLLMQARSDDDSAVYFVWAFVFLHIQLKKSRKETIKLVWDKVKFREALLDWVSDKSEEDREKATILVNEILEQAMKGKVEPIITGGGSGNA